MIAQGFSLITVRILLDLSHCLSSVTLAQYITLANSPRVRSFVLSRLPAFPLGEGRRRVQYALKGTKLLHSGSPQLLELRLR